MGRKQKQQSRPSSGLTRRRLVIVGSIIAIVAGLGYVGMKGLIPVNGTSPVLAFPVNHFIKAVYSPHSGYVYVSQSSGSVKGARTNGGGGIVNPEYTFTKGAVESLHIINEDQETHSKHNFNIDDFNVHTRDLGYFETQTITLVADKTGTFDYYCTIHPEMKGQITVE